MNKSEFVSEVHKGLEDKSITKKATEAVINQVVDVIIDSVSKGEKITLVGFGTFELRERAERKGKNPQNGKDMIIPASKAPAFKAGKAFKDAANK